MLSKTDIKNMLEVFATKEDLKKLENDFIRRSLAVFATKDDLKNFVSIDLFRETMDSVIEKLDAIYGEIKDLRDEKLVNSEFRRETREEIDSIKHLITAKS